MFRQFLTRFSTSELFLYVLKIGTEHGIGVPVVSGVGSSRQDKITSNGRSFFIILYGNASAAFEGLFEGL